MKTEDIDLSKFFKEEKELVPSKISPFASYPKEMNEAVTFLKKIKFPIQSKKEFVEKLGGEDAYITINQRQVSAKMLVMFFPALFFPVSTLENLAEKLAEYYAERQAHPRIVQRDPKELTKTFQDYVNKNPDVVTSLISAISNVKQV